MSISFEPVDQIDQYEFSRCSECGAVVVDIERHIHVAWHERLEQHIQRLWDHIGNMPGGI